MTYRRCICHPDDLPGVGISSGWVTANSLCHPDDILFHFMSSGWLNWGWFLIRMSYGNVIMSSGWDTLPFLSHPDEIANFDFPQHAVALQRFRTIETYNKSTQNFIGGIGRHIPAFMSGMLIWVPVLLSLTFSMAMLLNQISCYTLNIMFIKSFQWNVLLIYMY